MEAQKADVVGDQRWMTNLLKVCNNFLVIAAIESMAKTFALVRKSRVAAEDAGLKPKRKR